jgi:hypothetical protein
MTKRGAASRGGPRNYEPRALPGAVPVLGRIRWRRIGDRIR